MVKCLLCKQEDLSGGPSSHIKRQVCMPVILAFGELDAGGFLELAGHLSNLTKSLGSRHSVNIAKKRGRDTKRDIQH